MNERFTKENSNYLLEDAVGSLRDRVTPEIITSWIESARADQEMMREAHRTYHTLIDVDFIQFKQELSLDAEEGSLSVRILKIKEFLIGLQPQDPDDRAAMQLIG